MSLLSAQDANMSLHSCEPSGPYSPKGAVQQQLLFCASQSPLLTLTWIWLRRTAARRIMALARRWNSLPISKDFSKVVLRWSTSRA